MAPRCGMEARRVSGPASGGAEGLAHYRDGLRDGGRRRLRAAGVAVTTVRYDGITHDFMMLNPLSETHATRAAVAQAIATLRQALHTA